MRDKSTTIVGNLNILLSVIHRKGRLKISRNTKNSNHPINLFDIIDIIRKLHPTHCLQVHVHHLPRQTLFWATKQVSICCSGLK